MVTLKSESLKIDTFRHRHRDAHAASSYVKYEKRCKETERCRRSKHIERSSETGFRCLSKKNNFYEILLRAFDFELLRFKRVFNSAFVVGGWVFSWTGSNWSCKGHDEGRLHSILFPRFRIPWVFRSARVHSRLYRPFPILRDKKWSFRCDLFVRY